MADNMLIDGLIKFCDEKSKNIKLKAEPQVFVEIKQALEELKIYKECNTSKTNFANGYNKAIDEFAERMKRLNEEGEISVAGWNRIVDNIAKKMKAGGKNESNSTVYGRSRDF